MKITKTPQSALIELTIPEYKNLLFYLGFVIGRITSESDEDILLKQRIKKLLEEFFKQESEEAEEPE